MIRRVPPLGQPESTGNRIQRTPIKRTRMPRKAAPINRKRAKPRRGRVEDPLQRDAGGKDP